MVPYGTMVPNGTIGTSGTMVHTQRYVDQGSGTTPGLTGCGGLRRGQSSEVRRPRQLHPVYPGDRWSRQQSSP